MPGPYSIAVNAFNLSLKPCKIYTFPPCSLASISKLIRGNTIRIMIIPNWTIQYWFPTMLSHLVHHLLQLQIGLKMLSLPYKPSNPRPLSPKLQLLAVIVLGNPLHSSAFQEKLKRSSSQSGNLKLPKNPSLSKKWKVFCLRERENCSTPSVNNLLKILYYLY